jgi:uncharacterized protein (DUF885 family)
MKRLYLFVVVAILAFMSGCNGNQSEIIHNQQVNNQGVQGQESAQGVNAESGAPSESDFSSSVTLDESLKDLTNLPIDLFFEKAFNMILAMDPEWVLELGLEGFDTEEPILTGFGPDHLAQENQLYKDLLSLLYKYDFDGLDQADQISYRVFEYYLSDEIKEYESANYEYLINPLSVRSWPQLFIMFFTESHPLGTKDQAMDYVARMHLLDEKIDQLISRIEVQEAEGFVYPRLVIEYGRADIQNYLGSNPQLSPLRSAFINKSQQISSLDSDTRDALDDELVGTLKDEVFPAFSRLDEYLASLQAKAPEEFGLSSYPGGSEYYQLLLYHFTTTDFSADEIHALGLAELERIQAEILNRFEDLGYDTKESIPNLYQAMISDSGTLQGNEIVEEYERILQDAEKDVVNYFDLRPVGNLEVIGGDVGAFYSPGSLDGSRPGRFYARTTGKEPIYKLKTIAYHEGIPGHHYQITLAAMADIPFFRNLIGFTGYAEGWALYSEYLASEFGWYDDDSYGDLGRLQYEALRASRMVVDTGIHTKGWGFDQAVDFIVENTGLSRGTVEREIIRYISHPAQATAYLVGKIEIMRFRSMAEEKLGVSFDLKEFHNVVLQNGSMPLLILEEVIGDWVEMEFMN